MKRSQGKKIIESKWILRTKQNANGLIERRKARVDAKGFVQRKDLDYFETFASVARVESVRMVMTLAVEKNLNVHQLDFVSVYLNGDLNGELYLEIPNQFLEIMEKKKTQKSFKNKIFRFNKSLYGLKQSGRCWFKKLDEKRDVIQTAIS